MQQAVSRRVSAGREEGSQVGHVLARGFDALLVVPTAEGAVAEVLERVPAGDVPPAPALVERAAVVGAVAAGTEHRFARAVRIDRPVLVPLTVVDRFTLLGKGLEPTLSEVVDGDGTGDLVDPGAEITPPKTGRDCLPDLRPYVLIHVVEDRRGDSPAEERQQSLGVSVVQGAKGGRLAD